MAAVDWLTVYFDWPDGGHWLASW